MVLYNCILCEFSSNIKTHYIRHLKTKKHISKENNYAIDLTNNMSIPHKSLKIPQNTSQYLTNFPP